MHTLTPDMVATLRLDARSVAPAHRHALVLSSFRRLAAGESMELVDDREPNPVFSHLRSELPGSFAWHCIESGPKVWRVRIKRLATWWADGQCCGTCDAT